MAGCRRWPRGWPETRCAALVSAGRGAAALAGCSGHVGGMLRRCLPAPPQRPRPQGSAGTGEYAINYFFADSSEQASPWHHIALQTASAGDRGVYTFVCEIPRGATAKLEITKELPHNPIKQVGAPWLREGREAGEGPRASPASGQAFATVGAKLCRHLTSRRTPRMASFATTRRHLS